MTKTELNHYRNLLEAKKADLADGLRNREGIAIEKTADALDEVQLAGERELAIRNLDRESNLLRNVRVALSRMADGSYGSCMHCDEDISPKRLAAVTRLTGRAPRQPGPHAARSPCEVRQRWRRR